MWDKARSLFANLKIVSSEDQQTNSPEVSTVPGEAPPADPAEILAERDQLLAEVAELQDRMLRRQAEFENYRKRNDRDRADFLEYAGMEIVREIVPILDDFERARKTECSDPVYRQGIELIYQRLKDTLKKIGLEPIAVPAGTEFDPNLHQAVGRVETDEGPDNTILDEFQRGYNFKGKLLRPSMVRVAVKS
jgi:molecular chaperone GrpE